MLPLDTDIGASAIDAEEEGPFAVVDAEENLLPSVLEAGKTAGKMIFVTMTRHSGYL